MIKSARLRKKAAPSIPGVRPLLKGFFTGTTKYFPYGATGSPAFKKQVISIPNLGKATWTHVKNHPQLYGGIGGGAGLLGSGILLGNIGKSDLKNALDRSNTQLQKTTDALNKAKKGTGSFWGDLGNTFRWLIERFGKLFKSSPGETPKITAATK